LRGLSFSIGLCALAAAAPGRVVAQVVPASSADVRAPLDVQAARVVFDPSARSAVFEGDVRATQGALSLRSPRLVARYGADQKLLSLEAQGGVQLEGEGVTASAERATWSATDETLALEGAVTLTRGADVLQGTRLTYSPASGRIELEHARGRIRAPRLQLPGPVRP
jgi:lipopolysaccharide export system protein LptA